MNSNKTETRGHACDKQIWLHTYGRIKTPLFVFSCVEENSSLLWQTISNQRCTTKIKLKNPSLIRKDKEPEKYSYDNLQAKSWRYSFLTLKNIKQNLNNTKYRHIKQTLLDVLLVKNTQQKLLNKLLSFLKWWKEQHL